MKQVGSTFQNMSVDDLSERISVVYFTTERNNRGDIVKTVENVRCMIWAKVLPLAGKIDDTTPERINTVTYRITIRYRADILPDDEIIWRGRRLKITTAPFDLENRRTWLQFECREVIKDGAYQQT